jgi:hypothetical protein
VNQFFIKIDSKFLLLILSSCFSINVLAQNLEQRSRSQQDYQQRYQKLENERNLIINEAIRKSKQMPQYDCEYWGKYSFVDGFVIRNREYSLGKFVNKGGNYSFNYESLDPADNRSYCPVEAEFNPQTTTLYIDRRCKSQTKYIGQILIEKCK